MHFSGAKSRIELNFWGLFLQVQRLDDDRQKRALSSFFIQRWKDLLETTLGFRWRSSWSTYQSRSVALKEFAKVGSWEDAVRDFYSFRPEYVNGESIRGLTRYRGRVNGQQIELSPPEVDGENAVLYAVAGEDAKRLKKYPDAVKIPRAIVYYKNTAAAHKGLTNADEF